MTFKICCEDLRITLEYYNQLKYDGIVEGDACGRFSGHTIYYCPYCGKKLEAKE